MGKMKNKSLKDRVRLLKELVRNPKLVHLLQDPKALTEHLELEPEQQEKMEVALFYLSEEQPTFITNYILEPFVLQFGNFCKNHPVQNRWPKFEELGLAFRHMTSSFISERFLPNCFLRFSGVISTLFFSEEEYFKSLPSLPLVGNPNLLETVSAKEDTQKSSDKSFSLLNSLIIG